MRGWFDAFRSDGGPTLYSFNNRTPVTGDVALITLYVVFATLYFAFLVVFPGMRKEVRLNTVLANCATATRVDHDVLYYYEVPRRCAHF